MNPLIEKLLNEIDANPKSKKNYYDYPVIDAYKWLINKMYYALNQNPSVFEQIFCPVRKDDLKIFENCAIKDISLLLQNEDILNRFRKKMYHDFSHKISQLSNVSEIQEYEKVYCSINHNITQQLDAYKNYENYAEYVKQKLPKP